MATTNSVFISYRRESSWIWTESIYQNLRAGGIDVFYDIEHVRAGQFEDIILNEIRARPYFVLVLAPGSLERCRNETDFVRREIETAAETNRLMILLHTSKFRLSSVRDCLPPVLADHVLRNTPFKITRELFKFRMWQLVNEFLEPVEVPDQTVSSTHVATVERLHTVAEGFDPITDGQLTAQDHIDLGNHKYQDGDIAGALASFDSAVRVDPRSISAFFSRSRARRKTGDLTGAAADMNEARRLQDEFIGQVDRFVGAAHVALRQRDFDTAAGHFVRQIEDDPDDDETFVGRGRARFGQKDWPQAIADFSAALRLNPSNAQAYWHRATAHWRNGDLPAAISDLSELLRLEPSRSQAQYLRAQHQLANGDLIEALDDINELIQREQANHHYFTVRGEIYRRQRLLHDAIADYDEAIRLCPESSLALAGRAAARSDSGDLAAAIADYDEALRHVPRSWMWLVSRGNVRWRQGDLSGAIDDYGRAITVSPTRPLAFLNRAKARAAQGDWRGAIDDLDQGQRLAPDGSRFDALRRQIQDRA